ncbi:hypothetical protein KM914_19480 [Virgibacillus pantothenticus]|uniref:hypothetical protein n=1 Tax=Virgibacillus pantothenticus TaxID=1473 RepID=UPI00067B8348|nr:hypothetical protein [Virgibacillus pantothenticus]MBU8568562.1 hypothetical protein [Virgibacillus pantothenticus]MBU8602610.1 hypothetical protein [Virgibacillus pantothenticus]MBU8636730.1 hypothetical protein [Virgibacillus pantothenticus]MBU8644409.1 hypothetical protein [Virgibacillus pantothenticus]MBU8648512.1 hypothetical protein [Virgibacillus pantothenticus]
MFEKCRPYLIETYQAKVWAFTITKGPAATIYEVEANYDTCNILQQSANALYDWVAPNLPEDLTFIKNNIAWFSCTSHEEVPFLYVQSTIGI